MWHIIACLNVKGAPINTEIARALRRSAREMAEKGRRKVRLNCPEFEGVIRTEFEEKALGSFSGYEFEAQIEHPRGATAIRYLVSDLALLIPEEEIEEEMLFETGPRSDARARAAQYN